MGRPAVRLGCSPAPEPSWPLSPGALGGAWVPPSGMEGPWCRLRQWSLSARLLRMRGYVRRELELAVTAMVAVVTGWLEPG